ncbi:MAG: hypothetical protein ACI8ZB_003238 [Desulforhopalus sp.]|jgi:hypothetical protein
MSGNKQNRRNWTKSLTIVMLVAISGAVIGCLGSAKEVKTDRVYLVNSAGSVLFDHGKHSNSAESCAQCHHELYSATQATSCEACHDEGYVAEDFDHADLKEAHKRDCAKCHEESGNDVKPASCRECHPGLQPSETNTNSCLECHDDGYEPEMLEHDEYLEVEDHTCLGCHTPKTVSQVYHTNCTSCHLETLPDRFTTVGGDVSCGACHLL